MGFTRLIGAATISVYAAALVSYTQLPLPATRSLTWCEAYGVPSAQFTPFESFHTMWLRAGEIGWGAMLTSQLGLQVILNVLLMIPLGAIVRGYFHQSWFRATAAGFVVSLGIELTQATGLWGLYPCAYRLGDVDDLLTNTLGAGIGALLAPLLLFWMSPRDRLLRGRLQPRRVSCARRLASMVINFGMIWIVSTLVSVITVVVWRGVNGTVDVDSLAWVKWAVQVATIVVVLYVPALRGYGSLGQYATWLAPRWTASTGERSRGSVWRRVGRTSVIGVPFLLLDLPDFPGGSALLALVVGTSLVMIPFTTTHRSLSGVLFDAKIIDTRRVGGTT